MFTTDGPSASSSLISDKLSIRYALLASRCSTAFPGVHTQDGATYGHYLRIKKVSMSHRRVAAQVQRANVAWSYARDESS